MELDKSHGWTQRSDETGNEMVQFNRYDTFKELDEDYPSPVGYNKIRVHLVYDINHKGCHKATLVSDGNLADINTESVYYRVV